MENISSTHAQIRMRVHTYVIRWITTLTTSNLYPDTFAMSQSFFFNEEMNNSLYDLL